MPPGVHPASDPLPWNVWVLGYWPHLDQPWDRRRKAWIKHAGWYPTRRREWGWTVWTRSYAWRMTHGPSYWTAILPPVAEQSNDEQACLEAIMRDRYGGTKIDCPACRATSVQFHKVNGRRVFACPECLFQIAPTANTILHDTRTPLTSWFYAARLLRDAPKMSAKELQSRLGVTYKTAWRIRSKLSDSDRSGSSRRDSADWLDRRRERGPERHRPKALRASSPQEGNEG